MALITLLPETWVAEGGKPVVHLSQSPYWSGLLRPPVCLSTTGPQSLGSRGPKSSSLLPLPLYRRAAYSNTAQSGDRFAWPSHLCAAFNSLALSESYANPASDAQTHTLTFRNAADLELNGCRWREGPLILFSSTTMKWRAMLLNSCLFWWVKEPDASMRCVNVRFRYGGCTVAGWWGWGGCWGGSIKMIIISGRR